MSCGKVVRQRYVYGTVFDAEINEILWLSGARQLKKGLVLSRQFIEIFANF